MCKSSSKNTSLYRTPTAGFKAGTLLWSFLFCLICGCVGQPDAVADGEQPNIIFILTDDQRHDMLAAQGKFPWLHTPNLDRLVDEGAHFRNAFVTTSLCGPSRGSFLTGTYAHRHKVIVNETNDYDPSLPNFAELLQDAGYETAFIGKWHLDKHFDRRPGFDHWICFWNQGKYFGDTLNVNGEKVKLADDRYLTDELNDRALEFIRRERSKPFFLYLSHKAVHEPFKPAPRHDFLYEDKDFPSLDNPKDDLSTKPQYVRGPGNWRREKDGGSAKLHKSIPDMFRTVSAVDDGVGMIRSELARLGLSENTVVVFAGDNGYFMSEHGGLHDKRKAYEPSIRIPLVMTYPGNVPPETKIDAMVLNIDLAPTLLEIARAQVPDHMHGESWLGVLNGTAEGRKSFMYQYFNEEEYRPVGGFGGTPTLLAVRTNEWKFVDYADEKQISELYHLAEDPGELRNLYKDPEYAGVVSEMKQELESIKATTDFAWPKKADSHVSHEDLYGPKKD